VLIHSLARHRGILRSTNVITLCSETANMGRAAARSRTNERMSMVLVPTKPMESSMVRNLAWRKFFRYRWLGSKMIVRWSVAARCEHPSTPYNARATKDTSVPAIIKSRVKALSRHLSNPTLWEPRRGAILQVAFSTAEWPVARTFDSRFASAWPASSLRCSRSRRYLRQRGKGDAESTNHYCSIRPGAHRLTQEAREDFAACKNLTFYDPQLVLRRHADSGRQHQTDQMRICDVVQSVKLSLPPSYSATVARGSIAFGTRRLLSRSSRVHCRLFRPRTGNVGRMANTVASELLPACSRRELGKGDCCNRLS
jgi:hypothetical protein